MIKSFVKKREGNHAWPSSDKVGKQTDLSACGGKKGFQEREHQKPVDKLNNIRNNAIVNIENVASRHSGAVLAETVTKLISNYT